MASLARTSNSIRFTRPLELSRLLRALPLAWAPSLKSLADLLPPFLLAVPKKKVSHSRKAMRAANKGLKDKQSMYTLTLL